MDDASGVPAAESRPGTGVVFLLRSAVGAFTIVCFISMFCIVLSLVFYRFVLQKPHFWGEEAARYLMVTSLFLALSIGVREKVHLNVEFFVNMLPRKAGRAVLMVAGVITTLAYAALTLMAVRFVLLIKNTGQTSAAMKLPTWIVYAFMAAGFALCVLESVLVFYNDFIRRPPGTAGAAEGPEGGAA
jgi:TRAP-type C4-dicarboxylate transport system permease small subunit